MSNLKIGDYGLNFEQIVYIETAKFGKKIKSEGYEEVMKTVEKPEELTERVSGFLNARFKKETIEIIRMSFESDEALPETHEAKEAMRVYTRMTEASDSLKMMRYAPSLARDELSVYTLDKLLANGVTDFKMLENLSMRKLAAVTGVLFKDVFLGFANAKKSDWILKRTAADMLMLQLLDPEWLIYALSIIDHRVAAENCELSEELEEVFRMVAYRNRLVAEKFDSRRRRIMESMAEEGEKFSYQRFCQLLQKETEARANELAEEMVRKAYAEIGEPVPKTPEDDAQQFVP